jgi:hypothetical protein
LKFLYKIWSGYDGFMPADIPKRLHDKTRVLGWNRYQAWNIATIERKPATVRRARQ